MTDADAFLRRICENPADDTPRLVFADWLDDHDGESEQPCPMCHQYADDPENLFKEPGYHPARDPASGRHEGGWTNCKTCNGGGRLPCRPGFVKAANHFRERAEFIRVQCELGKWEHVPCECTYSAHNRRSSCDRCRDVEPLRRRELQLLSPGPAWAKLPDGWGWTTKRGGLPPAAGRGKPVAVWDRGFVAGVTADYATLFGGPCGRCGGDGDLYYNEPDANEDDPCPACRGTGEVPGIAADLFACQPVQGVTLTGKQPYAAPKTYAAPETRVARLAGAAWWVRAGSSNHDRPEAVPEPLYAWLPKTEESGAASISGNAIRYKDTASALDALSLAGCNLGRSRAKGFTHDGGPCPGCEGYGGRWKYPPVDGNWKDCPDCRGTGRLTRPGLPPLP